MNLVKTRFSLDDFILEMMQIPYADLQLEQLYDWMSHLTLSDRLFHQHMSFCSQHYQRRLLCRTPRFDLLILCWKPGQCSTIHDHADSLNVTRVYQGVLTSRSFEAGCATVQVSAAGTAPSNPLSATVLPMRDCSTPLAAPKLYREERLEARALATVNRHDIHQLANTADEDLVTLHVYARPLRHIQVYCPQSGRADQVPVQYEP